MIKAIADKRSELLLDFWNNLNNKSKTKKIAKQLQNIDAKEKDIIAISKRLKEAIELKNQCFYYSNFESWEYWKRQIECLEYLLDLYK